MLVEPVQKHQEIALPVRHNSSISAPLAFIAIADALLDEETAKPGIDQTTFDFAGALTEPVV
jgi:hypothetical protein